MQLKLAAAAALVGSAAAHMAMNAPCGRYNPNCPAAGALPPGQSLDYDIKAPIHSSDPKAATQPLCKHTTPWAKPVASWTAGQAVTVSFEAGGAGHGGGHCQFSLSYDGGKTFVVVHEELRHCFYSGASNGNNADVLSYTFTLPKNVPGSDKAIFAWTWVNAIGNREFYMNCADVAIQGTGSSYTGKKMTIANYPGYDTIPEFHGNYETGINLYTNAPSVTVTGSGYQAVQQPPQAAQQPPQAVQGNNASNTKPTPSQQANDAPVSYPPAVFVTSSSSSSSEAQQPTPTPSTAPAPGPGPGANKGASGGQCTDGAVDCTTDGKGVRICVFGTWSPAIACNTGTACTKTSGGVAYCGWP
ncbi:hypothetical protein H4R18_005293 [Coemansia javaensis]|uniref:Chitin-binding type-4 domain-containing protein n=1 Tax=Coemansia javaensis TaxID=2761396 RepID=A0A9W8LDK2_9FUNG|nr:hypothetical protein H4R18_005293 [Coemansia javaensis]